MQRNDIKRLFDFIYFQLDKYPQERCFGHRNSEGKDIFFSTAEMVKISNQAAAGLIALGVQKNDKVALVSVENRPEWTIMDLAIQQIGAVSIPVYPTISPREYEYIFNDSEVKYCFAGEEAVYVKVKNAKQNVPTLKEIFTFDHLEGAPNWKNMLVEHPDMAVLDQLRSAVTTEDVVTIIYTSGTTGEPKGVVLSHHNIVSNVKSVMPIIPIVEGNSAISFLPLCHIFERVCSYAYMFVGAQVTFTGTTNLGGEEGDLKRIKPMFFTCVPRLLEKVYDKIYAKGLDLKGIKRFLFFWALKLTNDYEYDIKYSGFRAFQHKIADKLIYSKWREALGGQVKGIVTGASACPVKITRTFSAAGVPIREGYGLTESSPGICITTFEPGGAMLGTVGAPIEGVEVMIDEGKPGDYRDGEGEVLACGPNIMVGYYKKPDKTAESIEFIDGKRYLRTGDVGKLVLGPNGKQFLKITDRKKELFKTSGGKYVAPAPLESRFKEHYLIEQIMAIGDNRKFVSALIIPEFEALKSYCRDHDIAYTNNDDMIRNPKVIAHFDEICKRYNTDFAHVEQIKKFTLLNAAWEPQKIDQSDAELTPTLKLKRRVILSKFSKEIEAMYEGD
ncbi:MAG: AMP-dependent synthetase/ligase [Saprospiraceae bacterium]